MSLYLVFGIFFKLTVGIQCIIVLSYLIRLMEKQVLEKQVQGYISLTLLEFISICVHQSILKTEETAFHTKKCS